MKTKYALMDNSTNKFIITKGRGVYSRSIEPTPNLEDATMFDDYESAKSYKDFLNNNFLKVVKVDVHYSIWID